MQNYFVCILGVLGGIYAIVVALFEVSLAYSSSSLAAAFGQSSNAVSFFYGLAVVSFIAGIIGISGCVIGKKLGGALMVFAGVLALIGAFLFGIFASAGVLALIGASLIGILPSILLLTGGILALRQKQSTTPQYQQQPIYQQQPDPPDPIKI